MAMLLLLCVGMAALLALELRVAKASVASSKARLNAMAGARIALGEAQRLLGPDQRATATAEVLCNPSVSDPSQASYYANPDYGNVVHPRWTGVWNSGRTTDTAVPDAAAGEETKVIQRTNGGYLQDSRFANGADWDKRRASSAPAGASKRLLGWLVSGNEALPPGSPDAVTPFTPPDATKDVTLLGSGTLGPLFSSTSDGDKFGARARRVGLPDAGGGVPSDAGYAWWMADEGVKARFNIRDRLRAAGRVPNAASPGDGGFAALLTPQGVCVDPALIESPVSGAPTSFKVDYTSGKKWESVASFADIPLADTGVDAVAAAKLKSYYFHDFSFVSSGLRTDAVNGGLKKDLGYYLMNNRGGDIADYGAATGSGLASASPILAASSLRTISPTFGLLASWWNGAVPYAAAAADPVGPTTFDKTFTLQNKEDGGTPPVENYTQGVPDLSRYTVAPRAPVVSQLRMFFKPLMDDTGVYAKNYQFRVLVYPVVSLWNPYSVPIRLSAPRIEYLNTMAVVVNVPTPGWSYTYVNTHPHITYRLPSVTIPPGRSVMFRVDPSMPKVGDTVAAAWTKLEVPMVQGIPDNTSYYVDSGIRSGATTSMIDWSDYNPPTNNTSYPMGSHVPVPTAYSRAIVGYDASRYGSAATFAAATYSDTATPSDQAYLMDGSKTLSQLNMENLVGNVSKADRAYPAFGNGWTSLPALRLLSDELKAPSGPVNAELQFGFRMRRLDGTEMADTLSASPARRGLNVNPLVDGNLRGPRSGRQLADGADLLARDWKVYGGAFTADYLSSYTAGLPSSPTGFNPFFQGNSPAVVFDVPRSDVGLYSLGALRSAPLNQMLYGPSLAFGSARIPLPKTGSDLRMTDRAGVSSSEYGAAWNKYVTWRNVGETVRQTSRIGASTLEAFDVSFELNRALWDGYYISGISPSNPGWNPGAESWRNDDSSSPANTLPSSRYLAAGEFPSPSGYFASPNYGLYKAAYTQLDGGRFNVNSTSVVAWEAMLGAFRGIPVPGVSGSSRTLTPYPRLLSPLTGAVSSGGFNPGTWSGYRALTDAEIRSLAAKIVEQVKKRGPFLGLSDFVNRRLKKPDADFASWTEAEADYLGVIEGAIAAANLNGGFDDALMDRTADDPAFDPASLVTPAPGVAREPRFRSRHKIAGAPAYLDQGDILQQLGPVLGARSDTFVIRARGESDGAVAWVEMVVQRTPEPLVPGTGTVLPVNPRAIDPTSGSPYAGNQFFGRRMRVVSLRQLSSEEI